MVKKSLSQQVADELYSLIMAGKEYQPGDKLPNEIELASKMGVGRTTLREALRGLATKGVLEIHRGKGTYIAESINVLGDFDLQQGNILRLRLRDIYEARLLFEPELAAIACRKATDKEIANIVEIGAKVEAVIRANGDRTEMDQTFHRAIAAAAHNEFLLQVFPVIEQAIADSIRLNPGPGALAEDTIRDHAMLMDFLQRRDAEGAKNAMSIHIHHSINNLHLQDPIY